jgi:hypothetical protein
MGNFSRMGKTHNKKRNVGIIYEQLLRFISECIVNKDDDTAQTATEILKAHYMNENTELYREFRIFNALVKTRNISEVLASRILNEAKKGAATIDQKKLREQKSLLIKDINKKLDDRNFYRQRVVNYKDYATIQTLMNDWKKTVNSDPTRIVLYESKVCKWLTSENKEPTLDDQKNEEVNRLTVKIMTEKFNKKYAGVLTKKQTSLIQEYVFSLNSGKSKNFIEKMATVKENALDSLNTFKATCDNSILLEKIEDVQKKLNDVKAEFPTDKTLSKLLLAVKLLETIQEKENEQA